MSKPYISDRRLCLNADLTRVVEENHADARFLFAAKGSEISGEDAERFNLTHDGSRMVLPGLKPAARKRAKPAEPAGEVGAPAEAESGSGDGAAGGE